MSADLPGSLLSVFVPPEGFVGEFGWICGFSGDAPFLDLAADRFTSRSTSQRAHEGRTWLAALLDPTAPQVPPTAAPGVLHLGLRKAPLPYRLLHAKVALLGFGAREGGGWCLRLVVSSGNWTRQTLEASLDVVWTVDLHGGEARSAAADQAAADLRAATGLLDELRPLFAADALTGAEGAQVGLSRAAMERLDLRLNGLPNPRGVTPRFFDNRKAALVTTLPDRVSAIAGAVRRNTLVVGSGFFGGGTKPDVLPAAVDGLVRRLRTGTSPLLTQQGEIAIVVNPLSCQEVARARGAMKAARWRVLPGRDPAGPQGRRRELHAKFVFGANRRNNDNISSPWVYLGSGNLTGPGFLQRAGANGNLEAGVVFDPGPLRWSQLRDRLPVDLTAEDLLDTPDSLDMGDEPPTPREPFLAPPFAWLMSGEPPDRLTPPVLPDLPVVLLHPDGARIPLDAATGAYPWPGPPAAEVEVAWTWGASERRAWLPILDLFGRLAGRALRPLTFDDLEDELGNFPAPAEVEEEETEEDGPNGGESTSDSTTPKASTYPIRQIMQAIELVASRQTALVATDWPGWCARVEQALVRMKDTPTVGQVRALGVNPLAALRRPEFLPDLPEGDDSFGIYDEMLRRVEAAWGFSALARLGEMP
jgi:hypothetical protein